MTIRDIQPRKTPCYCMNFRRMANALTKYYDSVIAQEGLTASQFSLLVDIQSIEPCNQSELAKCARLNRTTIIRNLEILRREGLIEDRDGKKTCICLTERGNRTLETGFQLWKEAQGKVRELFDPESRAVLREAFGKIDQIEALCEKTELT